jgi:hypothetical protein
MGFEGRGPFGHRLHPFLLRLTIQGLPQPGHLSIGQAAAP